MVRKIINSDEFDIDMLHPPIVKIRQNYFHHPNLYENMLLNTKFKLFFLFYNHSVLIIHTFRLILCGTYCI